GPCVPRGGRGPGGRGGRLRRGPLRRSPRVGEPGPCRGRARRPAAAHLPGGGRAPAGPDVPGAPMRARARRFAPWLLLLLATAVLAALLATPRSGEPFGPTNPGPDGAQALARVLGAQGVDVELVPGSARLAEGEVVAGP